jgi:glutathione reductase (NADPH)
VDVNQKKVFVEAANVIDANQRHKNIGIVGSEGVHIKWSDLIRFKRTFTEPFPMHREDSYNKAGIISFHGHAKFIGSTTLVVESKATDSNSDVVLDGKHILIALSIQLIYQTSRLANLGLSKTSVVYFIV